MDEKELREKILAVLEGAGLNARPDQYDSSIHSWRCEHPDRYGYCTHLEELIDELVNTLND